VRCSRLLNPEDNISHDAKNAQPLKDIPDLAESPAQMPFSLLMLFREEKRGVHLKGVLVAVYAQTMSNSFEHQV